MSLAAPKTPTKDPKAPKPAKKEDCVFEGNAANFQQLVLESKVPVLVDIYADWCGPCKQLGPMLEAAAMKSGRLMECNVVWSGVEWCTVVWGGVVWSGVVWCIVYYTALLHKHFS